MSKVTNFDLVHGYIKKLKKILDNDVNQEVKDIEIEDLFISLINDVITTNQMYDLVKKIKEDPFDDIQEISDNE